MLISVVIELECISEGKIGVNTGMFLQELFYGLLFDWNKEIFNKIHSGNQLKPFTVSPLYGHFVSSHGKLKANQGERYWFKLTSLSNELSDLIIGLINSLNGENLRIGGIEFCVVSIFFDDNEHIWAKKSSYEELFFNWFSQDAILRDAVRIRFLSPTYFRDGRLSIPLPIPELCMKSLLNKWNSFSGERFDDSVVTSDEFKVSVSYFNIESRILEFKGFKRIGFVGDCEFKAHMGKHRDNLRLFNLLWDYAFFAGVGASTTYGMGQVISI